MIWQVALTTATCEQQAAMSHLIFRLRNVPDDEAQDIRDLLAEHHIDFYETDAGNWGISMPGIWLSDDADREQAKALIESYQQQRAEEVRAAHRHSNGVNRSWNTSRLLMTLGLMVFCAVILYFSVVPFFDFLR